MKIITVVGARPQFIKCGPVSCQLQQCGIDEVLLHTGQHYDDEMSKVFFQELNLKEPKYNLGVGSGPHGAQTGAMLSKIEEILLHEKPDAVVVYGDTNSTLAGALAAAKLHIPLAHVEAGLRSFNRQMPEELNRVVTDHVSNLLFCPTAASVENLAREGVTAGVWLVGDVMYDALWNSMKIAERKSTIVRQLGLEARQYLLATVHRAENTDNLDNLKSILEAFRQLTEMGWVVVFSVHPRTRQRLANCGLQECPGLRLIRPVSYLDMLWLESQAYALLTDSGGAQKEACWLGTPCVTLRNETEWVETLQGGANVLAGANTDRIVHAVSTIQRKRSEVGEPHRPASSAQEAASRAVAVTLRDYLVSTGR